VVKPVARQNSGSVKEVMDEAVDRNHLFPDVAVVPPRASRQKQARQRHVGELRNDVRNRRNFLDEPIQKFGGRLIG
jgi:hypothetical protein